MYRALIFIIGLALLALLGWFCIGQHGPAIETDLMSRTTAALRDGGDTTTQVSVDGRDILLTGMAPDAASRAAAGKRAASVYGVRAVDNQLKIQEQAPVVEESEPAPLPIDVAEPEAELETEAEAEPEPQAAAVSCQQQFDVLLEGETVQFESGAAEIKRVSYELLNQIADVAKTCPVARVEIAGHTDSSGGAASNKRLSERRAGAVEAYLIGRGVQQDRLTSVGYGEDQPKVSNDTAAGRAENRRVELVVEGV